MRNDLNGLRTDVCCGAIGYTLPMSTDTRDHSDTDPRRLWHRAFGIALMDVFAEAPWVVELELEMALKSQLLDVAII
jgi:hypothetical protein